MRFPSLLILCTALANVLVAQNVSVAPEVPAAKSEPAATSNPPAIEPVTKATPSLPASLAGYELRELDIRKPVVFRIGNRVVEAQLPVFVYYPRELGPRNAAVAELRTLYENVLDLAGAPEVSPSDFRAILIKLDSALLKLESNTPPEPVAPKRTSVKSVIANTPDTDSSASKTN